MDEKGDCTVKNTTCPGCGAGYNGRRCRSCGYESFGETSHPKRPASASAVPAPRKRWQLHPLIRFLLLLYLIYSLLPIFRNWGLKLEAMEENARKPESSFYAGEN